MQIKGIMIKDVRHEKFFGYIDKFPGICAQGDSMKEVASKIERYAQVYFEKVKVSPIEFEEQEFTSY